MGEYLEFNNILLTGNLEEVSSYLSENKFKPDVILNGARVVCAFGSSAIMKLLVKTFKIELNDWVNVPTLLSYACYYGNINCARELIEMGSDMLMKDGLNNMALDFAIYNRRIDTINYLSGEIIRRYPRKFRSILDPYYEVFRNIDKPKQKYDEIEKLFVLKGNNFSELENKRIREVNFMFNKDAFRKDVNIKLSENKESVQNAMMGLTHDNFIEYLISKYSGAVLSESSCIFSLLDIISDRTEKKTLGEDKSNLAVKTIDRIIDSDSGYELTGGKRMAEIEIFKIILYRILEEKLNEEGREVLIEMLIDALAWSSNQGRTVCSYGRVRNIISAISPYDYESEKFKCYSPVEITELMSNEVIMLIKKYDYFNNVDMDKAKSLIASKLYDDFKDYFINKYVEEYFTDIINEL